MRGIVVCVGFDDFLSVSLPRAAPHFEQIIVVSSPQDWRAMNVVRSVPNAILYTTDAFYRDGAVFNKGLAIEEAWDACDRFRDGWWVIFDADIVMPADLPQKLGGLQGGYIYSPRPRMLLDPSRFSDDLNWRTCPHKDDDECAGYFQYFHARDPVLRETPWYGVDWQHAAGCDSDFTSRWSQRRRIKLRFSVLHLGPDGTNWCGRVTPRIDDGTVPPDAETRRRKLWWILQERAQTGSNKHEKVKENEPPQDAPKPN